ncbi:hypothetical protein IG631_13538 [Alternaria alternata]|nr:hypothetical protein IG631_13538 [Alternaria alternata]
MPQSGGRGYPHVPELVRVNGRRWNRRGPARSLGLRTSAVASSSVLGGITRVVPAVWRVDECSLERTFPRRGYTTRQISGRDLKRLWGFNGLKYGTRIPS